MFFDAIAVLQACKDRLALKHATFLLHFNSTRFVFSHHLSRQEIMAQFERYYIEGETEQSKSEQLIATRTGKTIADIRTLMYGGNLLDARLSAEEALSNNLIDRIIEDPKGLFTKK